MVYKKIWNWFWNRHEKVRYRVWAYEDKYVASASIGEKIASEYGSTPEKAKEAALFKLRKVLTKEKKTRRVITKGNGYVLYRIK
ncbi:hypothetical protein ACNQFZ_21085 [Schinkia sp. CFF1]